MIDLPPPGYEQTIAAVGACGIPAGNIRIAYEDELRSDVITISDLGHVTDEKLRCLRQAVHSSYILTIENGEQRTAYYALETREMRPAQKAAAVEALRAQGLLDRLPQFDPADGIERIAAALETSCGFAVGSAFVALDPSTLTFRREFMEELAGTGRQTFEGAGCLLQMFIASDAEERGISLGFIGNEAISDDGR